MLFPLDKAIALCCKVREEGQELFIFPVDLKPEVFEKWHSQAVPVEIFSRRSKTPRSISSAAESLRA